MTVLTVGHSTRPIDEFIALLRAHGVEHLVDVRIAPGSRRNPQFNRDSLHAALREVAIVYTHIPELGGLLKPRPGSRNLGWQNESFRGYADYMETDGFETGLAQLITLAAQAQVAIMCAEAVPWRCHRSLIADALSVRGVGVEHILSAIRTEPHKLTAWAEVDGNRISYPTPKGRSVSVRVQPVDRLLHQGNGRAQGLDLDGELSTGGRKEVRQRTRAAERQRPAIVRYCAALIFQRLRPQLDGAQLRKAVLHIVERVRMDVVLALPACLKRIL